MQLDVQSWTEIRSCWEATNEPVRQIARRYGIAPATIYKNASRQVWSPRSALCRMPVRSLPPAPRPSRPLAPSLCPQPQAAPTGNIAATEPSRGQAPEPGSLEPASDRVQPNAAAGEPMAGTSRAPVTTEQRALMTLRLIDLQLESMERTMSTGEPLTPQDQERSARALTQLSNQAVTVAETLEGRDAGADVGRTEHEDARAEAVRLRLEIVERLEKLHAQRLAQRGSE